MDPQGRHQDPDLSALSAFVRAHGLRHFRAAVSFLERARPTPVRVGEEGPVADEPLRFRHDPSLAFSVSDISAIAKTPGDALNREKIEITTTFLGLTGGVSPLPSYFSEEVARDGSGVAREFLDLFHHRLLSLLYRAVARYGYAHEFQRAGDDKWSTRIIALIGAEHAGLETARVLRWAPLLARRRGGAAPLRAALGDLVRAALSDEPEAPAVAIEEFVGMYVPIEVDDQIRLGRANTRLGGMVLGRQIFDRSSKVRIAVGPLSERGYRRFLQSATLRAELAAATRLFGDGFDFELALTVRPDALPGLRLGAGRRLGRDTFLGTAAASRTVTLDFMN